MKNEVRELRREQGLSQQELAKAMDVSRQTINSIETERYTPSLPLAMALARAGWRVVHAPRARARTEAPETVPALLKQRWDYPIFLYEADEVLIECKGGTVKKLVRPEND